MKKIYLLLFSFLVLSPMNPFQAKAQEIPLATGEWEPYTGQKMENFGFFPELVNAVFKEMGKTPKYSFLPWKRAEDSTKDGENFAAFPYIRTEEREKTFAFSDEVSFTQGLLFYRKDKITKEITYEKFDDLAAYTIGGTLGYWYEKPFKEAKLKVEFVAKDELNFLKLHQGKVDLVASDWLVGWGLIKKLYPNDVAKFDTVKKPLNRDGLRLMVSKKYPNSEEILKQFNASLKSIKDKGTYKAILDKFGLKSAE